MKRVAPFHYLAGRFVLLHHTFEPQGWSSAQDVSAKAGISTLCNNHWDLMFSTGEHLLTYRLNHLPPPLTIEASDETSAVKISIERLPNHRLRYLEYEGPISGNRGSVARCAAGLFKSEADEPNIVLQAETLYAKLSILPMDIGETQPIAIYCWQAAFDV